MSEKGKKEYDDANRGKITIAHRPSPSPVDADTEAAAPRTTDVVQPSTDQIDPSTAPTHTIKTSTIEKVVLTRLREQGVEKTLPDLYQHARRLAYESGILPMEFLLMLMRGEEYTDYYQHVDGYDAHGNVRCTTLSRQTRLGIDQRIKIAMKLMEYFHPKLAAQQINVSDSSAGGAEDRMVDVMKALVDKLPT